ncbi:MAG: hypothetical protein IIY16_04240 [Oscillospiraceae bacterium]|nr:hypothetical protein [Oscillospiraceae bacterium]
MKKTAIHRPLRRLVCIAFAVLVLVSLLAITAAAADYTYEIGFVNENGQRIYGTITIRASGLYRTFTTTSYSPTISFTGSSGTTYHVEFSNDDGYSRTYSFQPSQKDHDERDRSAVVSYPLAVPYTVTVKYPDGTPAVGVKVRDDNGGGTKTTNSSGQAVATASTERNNVIEVFDGLNWVSKTVRPDSAGAKSIEFTIERRATVSYKVMVGGVDVSSVAKVTAVGDGETVAGADGALGLRAGKTYSISVAHEEFSGYFLLSGGFALSDYSYTAPATGNAEITLNAALQKPELDYFATVDGSFGLVTLRDGDTIHLPYGGNFSYTVGNIPSGGSWTQKTSDPSVFDIPDIVTATGVGEATLTVTTTLGTDSASSHFRVIVAKQRIAIPEKPSEVYLYNGSEQTYGIAENSAYTVTNNKRTEVGAQTVTVSLKDKNKTEWTDGTTEDKTYVFTIAKATPDFTAPGSVTLHYNSTEQRLLEPIAVTGGTASYSLGTDAAPGDTWSSAPPKATESGTYYVWYKITGDSNHVDSGPARVTVTVEKGVPVLENFVYNVTTPSYNGEARTASVLVKNHIKGQGALTVVYIDSEGTELPGKPVDAGDYTLKLRVAEGEKYAAAELETPWVFRVMPCYLTLSGTEVAPTRVYDGGTAAEITAPGTLEGVLSGDEVTLDLTNAKADYADKTVGEDKTVSFSGFALAGTDAGNYMLRAQPADTTADITARPVTVIGTSVSVSKIYDGTTDAAITIVGMLENMVGGDDIAIDTAQIAAHYADKNIGMYKPVSFSGFALTGADAANYVLTAQPEGVVAHITVRDVMIKDAAVEPSKTYDGGTEAEITASGTLHNTIASDDVRIDTANAGADYADKTVGEDKYVSFSGFTLVGADAGNYRLIAQPADAQADITAAELTVEAAVKDKQYDGLTDAEFDGTPTLAGLADGDAVELTNGVPTFADAAVADDIAVSITDFAISGADAGNYTLTQPTGITASIYNTYAPAQGVDYAVNSNDWQNTDFVVTAAAGYLLSETDSADGVWQTQLTRAAETADGTLQFYVKNEATGAISLLVTEHYKIDKTPATGTASLTDGESIWDRLLETVTFGHYVSGEQRLAVETADNLSGVETIEYYESAASLTRAEVEALSSWTDMSGGTAAIPAVDDKQFVCYVRLTDRAGNVTYLSTDGAVYDVTAPVISGIAADATYCTTQVATVSDRNLVSVKLNGEEVADLGAPITLAGDQNATYTIEATDRAGTTTTVTVTMTTVEAQADKLGDLWAGNIRPKDRPTVEALRDYLESTDLTHATEEEREAVQELLDVCEYLIHVAKQIEREERLGVLTGDDGAVAAFGAVMLLSLAGMSVLLIRRRKREQ